MNIGTAIVMTFLSTVIVAVMLPALARYLLGPHGGGNVFRKSCFTDVCNCTWRALPTSNMKMEAVYSSKTLTFRY
jgi:hypothetical protein